MTSRRLVVFFGAASVLLVPWTIVLARSLPCRYVSTHWGIAWADTGLAAGSATAIARASAEALVVELPTAALCIWAARRFTALPDKQERSFT